MENRKIGELIGKVDASRRPYAAFVLSNPELIEGVDLVTYIGQLEIYEAEYGRFRQHYNLLTKKLSRLVRGLPEDGPKLEDVDIIGYSGFRDLACRTFEEIKSQTQNRIIRTSLGPVNPCGKVFGIMVYLNYLRNIPESESNKIIESAPLGFIEDSKAWRELETLDLRNVVQVGKAWQEREDFKYCAMRKLEKELRASGQRMPESIELGRFLEERLGLDYGGYDWKSYHSNSPPYFNDGVQCVNDIIGKSHLIGDLELELNSRK